MQQGPSFHKVQLGHALLEILQTMSEFSLASANARDVCHLFELPPLCAQVRVAAAVVAKRCMHIWTYRCSSNVVYLSSLH